MKTKIDKIAILFSLLILCVFSSCGGKEEEKKEIIRPVRYQKVVPGGVISSRTFSGTASSGTETKLSFKVGGTIETLKVNVGSQVKRNSLIATLDDSDLNLEYERADASVKNADAQEKQAKSNFERIRTLYENGNTSLSNYESAKASYESAKANESSAKKARKLAKAQLGYSRLYAPVEGKISMVDVEVNENVNPGQQIVMLSSEGDLEVKLGVPESYISNVNVQDEVDITFSALPNQPFKGVVSEVGFAISGQTSTYPVAIKISGETDKVRPGMAASVRFRSKVQDVSQELAVISSLAVGEDEEGNFVYVLEPSNGNFIVKRRSVTLGSLTSEGFEIIEGLEEGEMVATAGLQILLDGMIVKLYDN